MHSDVSIYISVDGIIYEVTYNRFLYSLNDVLNMISSAIDDFKDNHDMYSWDEELSSKLEIRELGNLPFGKTVMMKKSTDPTFDDCDEDIYDELYSDEDIDDEHDDLSDDDNITDW